MKFSLFDTRHYPTFGVQEGYGEWVAKKPKWEVYRNRPVSFAMVWSRAPRG